MPLNIRNRPIDSTLPPFIIAEIGVNHNGSLDEAFRLVDAAALAGVDAIKCQWFDADSLMCAEAELADYQRTQGETDAREMLRRLQLGPDALGQILDRAHQRGMAGILTVFSHDRIDDVVHQPWDAFKTASPDIIHLPLLEGLSRTGRPLLVSTGAATLDEIRDVTRIYGDAFFHCVSAYPTPDAYAHLAGIKALARIVGAARPVGYSDHTTSVETGGLAVMAGATILEKHLTMNPSQPGPDHAASLDAESMGRYVQFAVRAHTMVGPDGFADRTIEHAVRRVSRQCVVTRRPLRAGTVIGRDDLAIKRPGVGAFPPGTITELVGCTVRRDIKADAPLMLDDVVVEPARAGIAS